MFCEKHYSAIPENIQVFFLNLSLECPLKTLTLSQCISGVKNRDANSKNQQPAQDARWSRCVV